MDDKERGGYIRRNADANLAVAVWDKLVDGVLLDLDDITSQDAPRLRELVELGQLIADAKQGHPPSRFWSPTDHTAMVANLDAYADGLDLIGASFDRELGGGDA